MKKQGFLLILSLILLKFLFSPPPLLAISGNLLSNGDFESGVNGWLFGPINRVVRQGGAVSGNWYIEVNQPCDTCPADLGPGDYSLAFDVAEKLMPGQRYRLSFYVRSPQKAEISGLAVLWALGGESQAFGKHFTVSSDSWQKIELEAEIKRWGHDKLRVQVYLYTPYKNYDFDNFSLEYKPWIIGHKYLYHHIPDGTHWGGPYSYDFEGWNECYVCSGANGSANPKKFVGSSAEPWRREIGTGDGKTYPYLGVYDDSNIEMLKYLVQTQKNAGIEAWAIGFWSDALPQAPPNPPENWYYGGWKTLVKDLIPYFRQTNFKFFVIDEMVYNWDLDNPPETNRMKNHAIAVLKTFKNEPSYLRITGKLVYYLPVIDPYKNQNRLNELATALQEIEQSIGEEVYWLGYNGNFDYSPWASSKIAAFLDGYGLTGAIMDDMDTQGKIDFYSKVANDLRNNGKGMVMGVMPSFMSQYFNGDTSRTYRRNQGNRFLKSIDVFRGIRPRPVIAFITQAEWQEGKTIEPAAVWDDDNSTDPYKYLKILANEFVGKNFVAPPLPSADKIDPLRAGEVYGRGAKLVEVEVPSEMQAGKTYSISLTFKNTGEAPWTRQVFTEGTHGWYRLGAVNFGIWGVERMDLAAEEIIRKNESKKFVFQVIAPSSPGSHHFSWQMIQEGFGFFGEKADRIVRVTTSISLSPGWNQITWSANLADYTASSALADIDSDCGTGTSGAISQKKNWWEEYVKNFGGKNFNLQNNQIYFINVSKNCNWTP